MPELPEVENVRRGLEQLVKQLRFAGRKLSVIQTMFLLKVLLDAKLSVLIDAVSIY